MNLAVSENSGDFDYYLTMDQIGTEPNDIPCITGSQSNYHNVQVPDSYRVGSDLIVHNNLVLGNTNVNCNPVSNQIGTEPNDGLSITGFRSLIHTDLDQISLFLIISGQVIPVLRIILLLTRLVLSPMTDSVSLVIILVIMWSRNLMHTECSN